MKSSTMKEGIKKKVTFLLLVNCNWVSLAIGKLSCTLKNIQRPISLHPAASSKTLRLLPESVLPTPPLSQAAHTAR